MTTLWPPQERLVHGVNAARQAGHTRILGVLPTGGGKTKVAATWIAEEIGAGGKVAFYTNRKMLLEQSSDVFGDTHGIEHGIRASGHPKHRWLPFQICSIQSEQSWLKLNTAEKPDRHQIHKATMAIIDEAHLNASAGMMAIVGRHVAEGCVVVGLTATPIGLGHAYDDMVVGGSNSDLRACGALVAVDPHLAPDEPDWRRFKGLTEGDDLTEKENVKAIMTPGIFGRVYQNWKLASPDGKPTIGFGPGVAESKGFAEDFHKHGVRVAHIDGDDCWVNGEEHRSDREARDQIIADHKRGRIQVLWNRFVLREGIDIKWAEVGIFATAFGSLQSYLQSGGRLLRACPETGKKRATIIDHGGNWHRHGSLNADREWKLEYTGRMISGMRLDRIRGGQEREPAVCRVCKQVMGGRVCRTCGNEIKVRSRTVVQSDGTMFEMTGEIYKPKKIDTRPDAVKVWEKVYWRAKRSKSGMTFKQAFALYAYENGWNYPPSGLPLMPKEMIDEYRRVRDVDFSRLTGKPKE